MPDIKVFFEWVFATMLLAVLFIILAAIGILVCVFLVRMLIFLFKLGSGDASKPFGEIHDVGDTCSKCKVGVLAPDPIPLKTGQSSPPVFFVVCHKCKARFQRSRPTEERCASA